jgi:hypothetical protein
MPMGSKLAYYANAQLSLDNRGWQQYSRSGMNCGVHWSGDAVMAGRKIHGMVVGELVGDRKKPAPLPPWIWLKPAKFTWRRWQ